MKNSLTGIKNCHSCEKRGACDRKNSEENLSPKVRRFQHVNRSAKRHAKPSITVESMCIDFGPEESD